jgi:4-hydroxy-tetrahydrodipicolinate synthase
MKKLPSGLWPVMLTPFDERNEVDVDGLKALTHFYQATGADGLFANCLSSEMFQLTADERYLVTKTVVETVDGALPVVAAGTFGTDISTNADFIKRLYDGGVSAVVVNSNQLTAAWDSEAVFKQQIQELLNHTGDIPLGLYECPTPYKRLLSPELVHWLAQTGRFLYLKDTSCDLTQIQEKIAAMEDTALGLYNAHTPTGLASLQSGAAGLSPIGANLYPELFTFLIQQKNSNLKPEQVDKFNATLSLMDTVIHDFYPWAAKFFLQQRGLNIRTNSRIPTQNMTQHDVQKLDAVMNVFENIAEEFNIEISGLTILE